MSRTLVFLLASSISGARRISFLSLATSSLYFEEGSPKDVTHQMHMAALPHEVGGADSAIARPGGSSGPPL